MNLYQLDIDDLREVGSFKKAGGSFLIRVKSRYRPGLSAIIFQCILNEDNDGAPDCYGPSHPPALDPLADGTSDENAVFSPTGANQWTWVGVVHMTIKEATDAGVLDRLDTSSLKLQDLNKRFPLFQPGRQFYVSTTSTIANADAFATEQRRYWNARDVSYGALTPALREWGVKDGDFGVAIRTDTGVNEGFLYADSGSGNKVGESSRKLFRTLFPRADQETHPVAFIVFPDSTQPRAGGGFFSDPRLAVRNRMWDLSRADNMDTVIGLMASGRRYRDYVVGEPINIGPDNMASPQSQIIARALQPWGYDPEAAAKRRNAETFKAFTDQLAKDAARPLPPIPGSQ